MWIFFWLSRGGSEIGGLIDFVAWFLGTWWLLLEGIDGVIWFVWVWMFVYRVVDGDAIVTRLKG